MPLYREDLDQRACNVPGCEVDHRDEEIYFHAACHPSSPTWCSYRGDVLTITCAACRQLVATVVVASRASER